jgi:hypothetical protein
MIWYLGNIKASYPPFQVTQLRYLQFDNYHLYIYLREFDIRKRLLITMTIYLNKKIISKLDTCLNSSMFTL